MAAQVAQAMKDVEAMFLKYNSPQNVQSVINNTGSQYGKACIEKVLAALTESQKIIYSEVGKSGKLYIYNQNLLKVLSPEEITQTEALTKQYQAEAQALNAENATLREAVTDLDEQLTDAELRAKLSKIQAQIAQTKNELKEFDGAPQVTEKQLTDAKNKLKKDFKVWSDRRATVAEVVSNLAEGMDKRPKDLAETMGVDAGADKNELRKLIDLTK